MRNLFISAAIALALFTSCAQENTPESKTDTTTVSLNPNDTISTSAVDTSLLTKEYFIGNWKMVWANTDVKINPKARKKLMSKKLFFKFNADGSFFFTNDNKIKKGSWSFLDNKLCVLMTENKKESCEFVNKKGADKFSFMYEFGKKNKAEIILKKVE